MRPLPIALLASVLLSPGRARAEVATMFDRHVQRDGVHFQVAFGWGGGATSHGVYHNMELGGTFANGWTLAYEHVFIQSGGLYKPEGAPDLIGGHLLLLKIPVLYEDLVVKAAAGLGGTHDQTDGITAYVGAGWLYGVDLHLPLFPTSGLTLGVAGVHVVTGHDGHHAGWAAALGYTWF